MSLREDVDRLTEMGGLSIVRGRDGVDRIVVNNPWHTASQGLLKFTDYLFVIAVVFLVLGVIMFSPFFLTMAVITPYVGMLLRTFAPMVSPYKKWNGFITLGTVEEVEAQLKKTPNEPS